ncbi:MAG: hypothetical protein JWM68_2949 [Verrucomicrobiales bacterium]|nr:hypothetical protein [Verrucomicrobiales bacterium]
MPKLFLAFLFVLCFSVAALRENTPSISVATPRQPDVNTGAGLLSSLMGDSRRMFANHFFSKADAYFHSGYYPTIFDRSASPERSHLQGGGGEQPEGEDHNHSEHDEKAGFLGEPLDCLESFGRNFFPSQHSHLETGNERELLPWLKLSAELDPQKIETYTIASFWLRTRLGKTNEAEQFLREGLHANPNSYEILFELGRICEENHKDTACAHNLYALALQKWTDEKNRGGSPDEFVCQQITAFAARLEERAGNFPAAIGYLEKLKEISPAKDLIGKQILDLRAKIDGPGIPLKK